MKKQNVNVLELSLDIETDGPIPLQHSMSSFGVCTLDGTKTFYRELKPASSRYDPEYIDVNRLDRRYLEVQGMYPRAAIEEFDAWVHSFGEYDYVSFIIKNQLNFDGYFMSAYALEYLGKVWRNFKYIEFDSYVMGRLGLRNRGEVPKFGQDADLTNIYPKHHALGDAIQQARDFVKVRDGLFTL